MAPALTDFLSAHPGRSDVLRDAACFYAARADYRHDELNDGKFYTDPYYPEDKQRRSADTAAQAKAAPTPCLPTKG